MPQQGDRVQVRVLLARLNPDYMWRAIPADMRDAFAFGRIQYELIDVLPASLCEELAEALEEARIELNRLYSVVGPEDEDFVLAAEVAASEQLKRYREAVAEGGTGA